MTLRRVKPVLAAGLATLALYVLADSGRPIYTYQLRCDKKMCIGWVSTTLDGVKVWKPLWAMPIDANRQYEYGPSVFETG